MKIKVFLSPLTPNEISAFELGGLEFFGHENNFLKENYRSQDLQMIFIFLSVFSYAIRTKKNEFEMSGNITYLYRERSSTFYVNGVAIEKLSYIDLVSCLLEAHKEALDFLMTNKNVVADKAKKSVVADLNFEKNALAKLLDKNS